MALQFEVLKTEGAARRAQLTLNHEDFLATRMGVRGEMRTRRPAHQRGTHAIMLV